jgi:hypothetical protein
MQVILTRNFLFSLFIAAVPPWCVPSGLLVLLVFIGNAPSVECEEATIELDHHGDQRAGIMPTTSGSRELTEESGKQAA